jgi:hypothetical protein
MPAMTSMTMLACSSCWNPIGAGARPLWLGELAYHEVCAPRCRACQGSLSDTGEQRWTYEGRVVWSAAGYGVQPTEHWCDACRELHERDLAFAQD